MLGIRTQGKIGYSGTRTQINVVLTITLNTPGSVFLTEPRRIPMLGVRSERQTLTDPAEPWSPLEG